MHLFISNDTTAPYATLLPDESRHCVRVLRMNVGDELWVTSGDGTMCRARLATPDPDHCEVEIVERIENYQQRPFRLHLAVAPTKNTARLEWFVEKAVEIGIDRITPVICDHSERGILKTERLDRLALSAMKQSLKASRPAIDQPIKLLDFLQNLDSNNQKYSNNQAIKHSNIQKLVCYCSGDDRRTLRQLYTPGNDALVLIGPEGDFSDREITTTLQLGFQPVTLGNSRLRTETAALYATTVLNFLNES